MCDSSGHGARVLINCSMTAATLEAFAHERDAEVAQRCARDRSAASEVVAAQLLIEKLKLQSRDCVACSSADAPSSSMPAEQLKLSSRNSRRARRRAGAEAETPQPMSPRISRCVGRCRQHCRARPWLVPDGRVPVLTAAARCSRSAKTCPRQLEYVPAQFKVIRQVRPKLELRRAATHRAGRRHRAGRSTAGWPGPGLLAHVAVAKYLDHLPLYRQAEIYARQGIDLERSTLADWIGGIAGWYAAGGGGRSLRACGEKRTRRRYAGAGARSGPRQDQDRPVVDVCAR